APRRLGRPGTPRAKPGRLALTPTLDDPRPPGASSAHPPRGWVGGLRVGLAEVRDLDVPERLAQELGVEAERLAGLDDDLLTVMDGRLRQLKEAAAAGSAARTWWSAGAATSSSARCLRRDARAPNGCFRTSPPTSRRAPASDSGPASPSSSRPTTPRRWSPAPTPTCAVSGASRG